MPKSRTDRPRKTKIGTEVAHITCDSDTTFKVKGQGQQAALLTAVLACQAAAGVGMRTCWLWETAATLPSVHPRHFGAHGGRGGGGCILWQLPAYSLFILTASVGRIIFGASRLWGETSMGRNVLPWGEVSIRRNVRGAKSPDTV